MTVFDANLYMAPWVLAWSLALFFLARYAIKVWRKK